MNTQYNCPPKCPKCMQLHHVETQCIPSPEERAANSRELDKLHVGNRFRLMFGMPLLPENMDDTETLVCEDIKRRQQAGIAKYGATVAENPLTGKEWLQHAYEEALDLAIYLKRTMQELEKKQQP